MRKLYTLFFLAAAGIVSAQSWGWARAYGDNVEDLGYSIGVDQDNNIYVSGYNRNPASGSYQGYYHPLLQKYSADGSTLIWSDTLSSFKNCHSVTDKNGNTYLTGINLIAKYDVNGIQQWIKQISYALFEDIILSPSGGIITVGYNQSAYTVSFGQHSIQSQRGFLVQCDANGNWLWASESKDFAGYFLSYSQGKIYVAGTGWDSESCFVRTYDLQGNVLQKFVPNLTDRIRGGISSDDQGNFYISGWMNPWQPLVVNGNTIQSSSDGDDAFLVKYDSNGTYQWHKIFKGYIQTTKLRCDGAGNAIICGNVVRTLKVDSYDFTNYVGDIFVSSMSPSGQINWLNISEQVPCNGGCSSQATIYDMALDQNGSVLLTGTLSNKMKFGNYTPDGNDYGDMFIAKAVQISLAGIAEISPTQSNDLIVFPNPSPDIFGVSYHGKKSNLLLVSIKNPLGQTILSRQYQNQVNEIFNLSSYGKGIYFIEVTGSGIHEVRKIIIE